MKASNMRAGILIPLTAGNIRNNHIYLREAEEILPTASFGGSNVEKAGELLTVTFFPGNVVETDIDSTKMIFRNRSAVRDFFRLTEPREGDCAIIHRIEANSFHVTLLRR